jgi:hypothetical protein
MAILAALCVLAWFSPEIIKAVRERREKRAAARAAQRVIATWRQALQDEADAAHR